MFDLTDTYSCNAEPMFNDPIIKPNIRTGEGRTKIRRSSWLDKQPDLKKKSRRKMAKKSKRANRR